MLLKGFLVSVAAFSAAAAQGFPNLDSSTTCDETCQGLAKMGFDFETSQHVDPDRDFYKELAKFSQKLRPGALVSVETGTNLTDYVIPAGLTMSRIIYTTEDLNGKRLPASAYILWPAHKPPKSSRNRSGAFPMVAWAHGTTGVFGACAPSNYKNLQYNFMVPFALALQGMVVVAPDYAGLGVDSLPDGEPIHHAYGASPAQANDVANSIVAARTAFRVLSMSPFVTMGHSQGGGVAWAFAERQVDQPVEGHKGTIALAPPTDVISVIAEANKDLVSGNVKPWTLTALGFVQHAVISGVTSVYPKFNFTGMTETVFDRFHNVMAKLEGCLPTDGLVFALVNQTDLGVPGWTSTRYAREFQKRTKSGGKKIAGPMLVLAGGEDAAVQLSTVDAAVDHTCALNRRHSGSANIEYTVYEAQDHFPLIQASQSQWMEWIQDRLQGHEVQGHETNGHKRGCSKTTVAAFRSDYSQKSTTPNWLLEQASAQEVWKYSL